MSHVRGRILPVLLGAALLVGGANLVAYAANGHPLLLGRTNHAVGTTTVVNDGRGPALSLQSGRKAPPLSVTSRTMVTHLNADTVDGLQGKSLQTNARTFAVPSGPIRAHVLKGVKPGRYLASLDIVMATSSTSSCHLDDSQTGDFLLYAGAPSDGVYAGASGTAVIKLPVGSRLFLDCNADVSDSSLFHNTVSVIPLGHVTAGSLVKH
jgi:hypothetical protein